MDNFDKTDHQRIHHQSTHILEICPHFHTDTVRSNFQMRYILSIKIIILIQFQMESPRNIFKPAPLSQMQFGIEPELPSGQKSHVFLISLY